MHISILYRNFGVYIRIKLLLFNSFLLYFSPSILWGRPPSKTAKKKLSWKPSLIHLIFLWQLQRIFKR